MKAYVLSLSNISWGLNIPTQKWSERQVWKRKKKHTQTKSRDSIWFIMSYFKQLDDRCFFLGVSESMVRCVFHTVNLAWYYFKFNTELTPRRAITMPAIIQHIKYSSGNYIRIWRSEVSTPYKLLRPVPNGLLYWQQPSAVGHSSLFTVHTHTHFKDIAHLSWLTNERALWLAWPAEMCIEWDRRRPKTMFLQTHLFF